MPGHAGVWPRYDFDTKEAPCNILICHSPSSSHAC